MNVKTLIWNLRQLSAYRQTAAYEKLINSNGQTQLLAMPLALAMVANAGFIDGLVFVPGLTILGIMLMRQQHGMGTTFEAHSTAIGTLTLTTMILAVQGVFTALGLSVLHRQKYAAAFLTGEGNSAGAYALVCPAVAFPAE